MRSGAAVSAAPEACSPRPARRPGSAEQPCPDERDRLLLDLEGKSHPGAEPNDIPLIYSHVEFVHLGDA